MRDVLSSLQEMDLASQTQKLGQLVQNGDPWLLGVIVVLLVGLGHKLAIGHRLVYGWGLRLAALTFLGYGTYAAIQAGGLSQFTSSSVLSRSAIVAGSVLALSWILLPFLLFVYANFRFGAAGFVGYVGYALVTAEALETAALPGISLRALLVAGLAMVLAWILRPVWEFVAARWPARPAAPAVVSPVEKAPEAAPRLSRRERRRLARERKKQAEPLSVAAKPEATGHRDSDSRRRDKARLEAELAYLLAASELGKHLPRELFDRLVLRYLGDHLPPEEVEDNSQRLQQILQQQQQTQENAVSFSREELHQWFLDEQRRIQDLPLDPDSRQLKLLALQELYVSLSQRLLAEPTVSVVPMLGHRSPHLLAESLTYPESVAVNN